MKISAWFTAALAGVVAASPVHVDAQQADISRYCSSKTSLCYSQWISSTFGVSLRIAIPPVTAAPFDIAIQIVAPRNFGWAGISWGGSMIDSPLTVGWLNGNNVTLSSRYSQVYQQPTVWGGATYRLLPDHGVNSTHWTLSAVCTGCSYWSQGSIDPTNTQNYLAVALNSQQGAVSSPSSASSTFQIHSSVGRFLFDFTQAKQSNFNTATKKTS